MFTCDMPGTEPFNTNINKILVNFTVGLFKNPISLYKILGISVPAARCSLLSGLAVPL